MIRKFEPCDIERVMQLWLEENLDAHDFVSESYRRNKPAVNFYIREGLAVVSEEIDKNTGEIDCTMAWGVK